MANNEDFKQHISIAERLKWNKVIADFENHLGSGGRENHRLGDGSIPGFSTNNYTNEEKEKLASIQWGALNNPHPQTHPYTMITGLSTVAHTGEFADLLHIPSTCYIAEKGNCDTVGGIRFTVGPAAPASPTNNKDVWFDTTNRLVKVYFGGKWNSFRATFD